jgi:WD40 repeat protein
LSGDGSTLATSANRELILWDVPGGKIFKRLLGHGATIQCLAFSPDGRTLASGSIDGALKLWNVRTGQELLALSGHTGPVISIAFSPNSQFLVSSAGAGEGKVEREVYLWRTEPRAERKRQGETALPPTGRTESQTLGQRANGLDGTDKGGQ